MYRNRRTYVERYLALPLAVVEDVVHSREHDHVLIPAKIVRNSKDVER